MKLSFGEKLKLFWKNLKEFLDDISRYNLEMG